MLKYLCVSRYFVNTGLCRIRRKYSLGHTKFLYIEVFNESHQNVNNYYFVHTAILVIGQYNSHGIYRIHRR